LWLFATFDLPGGAGPVEAATVGTLSREVREALVTALRRWTGTRQTGAAATRLAVELAVVVAAVARRHRPPADNPRQPELELLERIRDWLAARPAAGGGLRELSRHVGLSESRLRAWFRATFGISLGRYLRETRCRQAAQCLREGGVTVAEIAERFGFATAFSFSRTFKAVLGISPRELLPQREGWPRGRPAAGRQAAAAPTPGRNG
jgi:AraC family L-rhamnose operon transcriptional activator RhaR